MTAIVLRHWKHLAVLLALLLIWLHGDHHGAQQELAKWELIAARDAAKAARITAQAERQAREQEQKWAAAMDATAAALIQEKTDVEAHRDRLLAAVRSGGLRVPPACPRLPETAPGSPGGDAAAGGQVSGAAGEPFAEFLIGEATRADQIAAQLAACQEAHRVIR